MVSRDESERWRRSEAIADACLELPTERRAHFLVDRCRDDSELLEAALDLVLAAEEAADIPTPVWRPRAGDVAPQTFDAAEDIDRFEVGEKLGEGGMGIVYRAQQTEPVERQVALKVARHPIHGEGQTRLAIERQAMAKLQHPNIAQVLEAGSTAEGHPYFAMELVEGARPITQYCDRRRLGVDSRLRLFLEVCSGVQHAHQKGIVHRDLKPSNIVVRSPDPGDTTPTAKIIDFGIAKVLEDEALPPSLTGGQILGTPAYLSPESLSGAAADTRTDVYSLGVVLFELLVGRQPFPRRDGETPLMHLQRIVDSPGAPRLSRAWSQLDSAARSERARALGTSPRALDRRFRGDLQWILQAALAVDPDARYATVAELASDLGRFLRNEPVLVGPPSRRYRLRKFVSRHRTASISALLVTLSLVGGLVARTFEADRANREARDAALARDENARMLDFVLDLFAASDPAESQGRELSARDVLKRGTEQLNSGDLDESPRVRARLLGEIAEIHWALGDPREGLTLAEQALALNREDLGALHPETAGSLHLTGT
ncbi:MAG: serine/threonine-protein kinase [Acidobacteriota bacterium]